MALQVGRGARQTAVVCHDYLKPSYAAAMPARKGDVVEILDDRDKDWFLCVLRGKKGFIPASFVQRAASGREAYQKAAGERQRPVRYRAITSATVRAGLDKLSKGCGRIEAGEVIVGIECVEFEGTTRIRCSRGWVGQRTRAGKQKLVPAERQVEKVIPGRKILPGVSLAQVVVTEEGADELFDDEEERARQWLGLQGCSDNVASEICSDLQRSGCRVKDVVSHLGSMEASELKQLISATTMKLGLRKGTELRLTEASKLMQSGDYQAALEKYTALLNADGSNEEAKRGAAEAQKGLRFLAIAEGGQAAGSCRDEASATALLIGPDPKSGLGGRLDAAGAMSAMDEAAEREAASHRQRRSRESRLLEAAQQQGQRQQPQPQPQPQPAQQPSSAAAAPPQPQPEPPPVFQGELLGRGPV